MTSATINIASHLPRMADRAADQAAVIVQQTKKESRRATAYVSITFAELEALSNRYANGLVQFGITRDMRVLLMVRPGFDFVGLVFALFKMGAVPVMIDPGMGVRRMLECIRQVDLQTFIGLPIAHAMRVLRPRSFKSVSHNVTLGKRWFWGGANLRNLARGASDQFRAVDTSHDDHAAILFTSGSTGPAKGVVYEHGMFDAQVSLIRDHYGIEAGEVDLPTFPLFALFSVAMGMTIVIPDMDPSHPARVDPSRIVQAIADQNVTNTFGSPAVWTRVAAYCERRSIELPTLRRILIAGAPVPYPVIESLHKALNKGADVHTPYGATECLPVTSNCGREILGECVERSRTGGGICVGKPLPSIDLRIIRIADEPIPNWSDDLVVKDGQPGEIVVTGPIVTKSYFGLERATALAKIRDEDRVWHRIGDIGYRDDEGRIWFCGRKAHRVVTQDRTLFSVPCEAIFNEHPKVNRCALVGLGTIGQQRPVIIVEKKQGRPLGNREETTLRKELLLLGKANEQTTSIQDVLFHRSLPVDVRHNAKINREALADWARGEVS